MQAFGIYMSYLIGSWYWLIPFVNSMDCTLPSINTEGDISPRTKRTNFKVRIESAAQAQGAAVASRRICFLELSPHHEATFLLPPELSFFLPAAGKRNQHHRAHVLPSALLTQRTWF